MEEKILKELELIRKEHNRLKEISYQDLKEICHKRHPPEKYYFIPCNLSDLFCLSFIFFSTVSLRDFDFPKS